MEAFLAFLFSAAVIICYCCGLRVSSDRGASHDQDHYGPVQRAKGLLVKKEISSYRPINNSFPFRFPYCSDLQKVLFLSTFQIDGETVLFYSDTLVYDKMQVGKTYRLRYQGNRIISVKKGKG